MAAIRKERRQGHPRALSAVVWLALATGCSRTPPARDGGPDEASRARAAAQAAQAAAAAEAARVEREFPLHGYIRARQLRLQEAADRGSEVIGWLRRGARVRLAREPVRGPGCTDGWYAMHPRGFVCKGTDALVGETPPEPDVRGDARGKDAPLPYAYLFVTSYTAEYFRPPEGAEWRAAVDWVGRYRFFATEQPERLRDFLDGKVRGEPAKPEVVYGVLPRGYVVAAPVDEAPSPEAADWVRTVQGRWVARGHVSARRGSSFVGLDLTAAENPLPIAIVNRPSPLQRAVDRGRDGVRFVDDDAASVVRYQRLGAEWRGRTRLGDYRVHRIGEDRYLKEWYVSVLDRVEPEFSVADDELWIHVDLSEQTLLAYRGRTPFFGTLVSTGMPGHETPRGVFRIERKFVGSTMDNLGPEVGADDYRIEDVPHTQYFREDVALHGAFWHDRFGIARSHGCVNLAPADAHRLFALTTPTLPPGWHGIPTRHSGQTGTRVWVTP